MRVLTSKEGDLMSFFDKTDETEVGINKTTMNFLLINNHISVGNEANKGKIVGQLPFENIFGFCKTFKKITK